jgi:hypothetical protein
MFNKLTEISSSVNEIKLGTESADDHLATCIQGLTDVCALMLHRIETLEAQVSHLDNISRAKAAEIRRLHE